jgi:hypothetical protein
LALDDSTAIKKYMNWVLTGTGVTVTSVTGGKV